MSDEPANDDKPIASTPVELGENPANLVFKVAAIGDRVVVRLNALVQWFEMDPQMAINLAESIITKAQEAANNTRIVVPRAAPTLLQ